MNNQIKGLLFYFSTHMKRAFVIFWSILFGILLISLATSYVLKDQDGFMTFSVSIPLYFFCAVYGFTMVKKWIPYFLKVGATRKNIFFAIGLFFCGVSAGFALIATILQSIANLFLDQVKIDIFSFIHLSMFFEDTWYVRFIIDLTMMLAGFTFFFILGLVFYKYGLVLGGILLASLFFGLTFSVFKGWIHKLGQYIVKFDFHIFWQLALLTIVFYALSWLFLRRITTIRG